MMVEERDELSEGWEWMNLTDIVDFKKGKKPEILQDSPFDNSLPYIDIAAFEQHSFRRYADANAGVKVSPQDALVVWDGARAGLVGSGVNGLLGSTIAALTPKGIDRDFLIFFLQARYGDINANTKGSAIPHIDPKFFWSIQIPLPPLDEQLRIVARIEEFAWRAKEALERLDELKTEFDLLCRAMLFAESDGNSVPTPMSELVRLRPTDVTVRKDEVYHFAGVYSFGRGVFKGPVKSGAEFAYSRLTRIHTGEFTYPKLMAWEGGLGVVPPECDGFVVSPEFPVFEVNQDRVLPETLDVYFRSPSVWPMLSEISAGTNARRKRLHPKVFLAYEMPLPPMKTQQRLREMKIRVDELRKRHAQQRAELEALMPSVLDRAFRGEL
jgi:restriction endonuclease S subunit